MYTISDQSRNSVRVGTILHDVTYQFKGKSELIVLREQCRELEVESIYQSYMNRLRRNLLISFFAILTFITCAYCLLLATFSTVLEDLGVYLAFSVLSVAVLIINTWKKVRTHFIWIVYITTLIAVVLLLAMDITVPIIHAVNHHEITVPLYYSFTIYSIYLFMPNASYIHALVSGSLLSLGYIVFFILITYRLRVDGSAVIDSNKILSESIFMASINLMGLFFRLFRELVIRTTFIDKRECVEENMLLQAAKTQERVLLLSMIPAQIADKMQEDIKLRLSHMMSASVRRRSSVLKEAKILYRKLFVETHNDVTILYADMVNYTHLTTTLDAKTLVTILHDVFVKFDNAALELDVLRIQFLGDCYLCAANVSIPNEQHAKACVKLGLQMISYIREERESKDLEIDIRIGVHSGSVLSGVIGAAKWQFDIYSKDVDIANRLESTGQPGRVHVSGETLNNLDESFRFEAGTEKARHDPLLQKYSIDTYLILPPNFDERLLNANIINQLAFFEGAAPKANIEHEFKSIYTTEFIHSKVNEEMRRESGAIPVETVQFQRIFFGTSRHLTLFEKLEKKFRINFSWLFMCFKTWRWELNYMEQPDLLLKYSILLSYIIILCTITMQVVNAPQSKKFWFLVFFGNAAMLFLLISVWYKKLWEMCNKSVIIPKPRRNSVSRWFFMLPTCFESDFTLRMCLYLGILALQLCYTLVQLSPRSSYFQLDCDRFRIENEEIEVLLFQDGTNDDLCFNPWAITECIILNLFITFLFPRITYIIKLIVGVTILSIYVILILVMYDFIYERSISTNSQLYPEYSHIFVLCVSLFVFNIMNRQNEFIARVDYYWKRELKKKQDDAKFTNTTISRLISNILPSHIVDIYMDNQLQNKLYYEEYSNVAVMFATILNYDIEVVGIRVLNEIICDFDEVLSSFKGVNRIEKIKVAGWTYMAACGLYTTGAGHRRSTTNIESAFSISRKWRRDQMSNKPKEIEEILPFDNQNERPSTSGLIRRRSVRMFNDEEEPITNDDVVYVMARFALNLLRAMRYFNNNSIYSDAEVPVRADLRIGIANGPVMAGVVGLYKPHYDIWGNAVNMASRMDSTGNPNEIQVTEEIAETLKMHKVQCTYRGITYVKGRGSIPTYFIAMDDYLYFKRLSAVDDSG